MWIALGNALALAVAELWRHRTRTALTSLGILIGVAAVIAMVGLGRGATRAIEQDLESIGVNMLMIVPGVGHGPQRSMGASPLELADVEAIRRQVPHVAAVTGQVQTVGVVVADDLEAQTNIAGVHAGFFDVTQRDLSEGRVFTAGEERSGASVCILGATVREALFGDRPALGARIRAERMPCEVIGILEAEGDNSMGMDQDDFVLAPIRAVQRRVLGTTAVPMILVSADSALHMDDVTEALDTLMRERRHVTGDETVDFTIRDTRELASTLGGILGVLTMFLAAVAGVALLVGGIGIMNIMLVSVTERTREIGIRMAIGALESDIRNQFLVEATVLAVFGGILGVGLGIALTRVGAWWLDVPFVIDPGIVGLAVGFSAAMGLGFGWWPARRAARLEPIDALRHTG